MGAKAEFGAGVEHGGGEGEGAVGDRDRVGVTQQVKVGIKLCSWQLYL